MTYGQPRQITFCNVVASAVVPGVGGDELRVSRLRRHPARSARMHRIKRSMTGLMDQRLLQDSIRLVKRSLANVDEQIVVPTTEGLHALMNPNGLHPRSRYGRQTADDDSILPGFDGSRVGITEFRVDLELRGQPVVEP